MKFYEEESRIPAEGGITLHAWLFRPQGEGPFPAVTVAHGFAGVKYQGLRAYAERFARSGFVVVVHDHRNFALSGGDVRGDIDPWQQIADWRRVISYLEALPYVDPSRIGLWGSSYAGGHALVLAATDRRIKPPSPRSPPSAAMSRDGGGCRQSNYPLWRRGSTRRACPAHWSGSRHASARQYQSDRPGGVPHAGDDRLPEPLHLARRSGGQ